jgi:hypothetical protein
MRILIACEFSGIVRRAFLARGHDAWSCDLLPAEDGSNRHITGDVRDILNDGWDLLMVAHPPCTRLCNSGVRWLHTAPPGRTRTEMWAELDAGAALFSTLWNAEIPRIAAENPVMHKHAKARIAGYQPPAQIVQPWWFGDPEFKATGLYLKGLPKLTPTNRLTPPERGTTAHKAWSRVHRMSRSANRSKERSRFFPGIAHAMADQWGGPYLPAAANQGAAIIAAE